MYVSKRKRENQKIKEKTANDSINFYWNAALWFVVPKTAVQNFRLK